MTDPFSFSIVPESPSHDAAIEALHADVFGPGRFARTAFRVREGCPADRRFSFVALREGNLAGSVRLTPVSIGAGRAFLLGPLCVLKSIQGIGIGKALVRHAIDAVWAGAGLPVFLVGDPPYYAPLGFGRASSGVRMPGPVDYARLLVAWPDGVAAHAVYDGVVRGEPEMLAEDFARVLPAFAVPHGRESAEKKSKT